MASFSLRRTLASALRRPAPPSVRREFSALTLLEEFDGLPATFPEHAKASTASISTLSNGATLVTEDGAMSSTVCVHFPKAGSGSELVFEQGAALANKCLNFRSAGGYSTTAIMRGLKMDSAVQFNSVGRRGATLGFTASPEKAIDVLGLCALESSFELWDLRDAKAQAAMETEQAHMSPEIVLTEHIHAAAYGAQSPMGRPFYSPVATNAEIISFRNRAYGFNGAIVSATGVKNHESFVRAVEEEFSQVQAPAGNTDAVPDADFIGGESRLGVPHGGYAHVALAFPTTAKAPLRNVVRHCLNLMGSGYKAFETEGLIGVYGGAYPEAAEELVDSICGSIINVPSDEIVKKARTRAKAEAVFGLESGSKSLADTLTTYVKEFGNFTDAAGLATLYDEITETEVVSTIETMYKANLALAAVGEIVLVPYQSELAPRFK